MIGRADDHRVDVGVVQQATEVRVERGSGPPPLRHLSGPSTEHFVVDVAQGHALDLGHLHDGVEVGKAHAVAPDDAHSDLVTRCDA